MRWFRSQWDRASAAVLALLGLITLLLGYLGASSTPYPAEQLPYMISGGVLGIFFLGAAAALYISADLRDEWRKLNSIDASLKAIVGTTTLDVDRAGGAESAAEGSEQERANVSDDPPTAPVPAAAARAARTARTAKAAPTTTAVATTAGRKRGSGRTAASRS